MAKEYTVTQFRIGDFQDQHGNTWCDMALLGVGEPVRIVVKDPLSIKADDVLYGEIKEMTSKAGKPYLRFYKAQREDEQQSFASKPKSDKPDEAYWADKQAQIKAQWAIGQAVTWCLALKKDTDLEQGIVQEAAKEFFAMVDRVKVSGVPADVPKSGYEQAKAVRATLRVNEEENIDEEYERVVKNGYAEDSINLDDIPF